MKIKAAFIFVASIASGSMSYAAIECRVICTGEGACVTAPADGARTPKGAWKIPKCDASEAKTLAAASVWYSRNSIPVLKELPANASLAAAVADGDASCRWIACLMNVKTGSVSGANPMGKQTANGDVNPTIAAAGLPFDEVAVPAQGLSFKVANADGGGTLSLVDEDNKRSVFQAPGGNVLIPAQQLKPGAVFTYEWVGPSGQLRGGFSVARIKTVQRATETAEAKAQGNTSPENKRLALASSYLSTGLRWNALKLLNEIERGE